jgi:DHA2 family multidrug resistance protein-like MFS transporter
LRGARGAAVDQGFDAVQHRPQAEPEPAAEFGGSLGIAVLGSIGAAVYGSRLGSTLPAGLSTHAALLATARDAFTGGMNVLALVGMLVLASAAALTITLLRQVSDQPTAVDATAELTTVDA